MSKGKFQCNWCGEMKPVDERVMEKDKNGFLTWVGCRYCHGRRG